MGVRIASKWGIDIQHAGPGELVVVGRGTEVGGLLAAKFGGQTG